MKFMDFCSFCSYCCLANLLEKYGIDKETKDIALEIRLPYIFRYNQKDLSFCWRSQPGKTLFQSLLSLNRFSVCR